MKIFIFTFFANFAIFAALLLLGNLLGAKRRRNVRKLFDEALRTPAVFHCGAQLRRVDGDAENLSLSHQFFIEHGSKHLDPNEPYAHLTRQEFELLPSLWRSPDRVLPTRDPNRSQLELDTIDGGFIMAIVDKRNGLKSIQKRINPGGSIT